MSSRICPNASLFHTSTTAVPTSGDKVLPTCPSATSTSVEMVAAGQLGRKTGRGVYTY